MTKSVVALNREYQSTKCAEALSESAVALIREYRSTIRSHIIEVSCHFISDLRQSYNYMCSGIYYHRGIKFANIKLTSPPRRRGTVCFSFGFILI